MSITCEFKSMQDYCPQKKFTCSLLKTLNRGICTIIAAVSAARQDRIPFSFFWGGKRVGGVSDRGRPVRALKFRRFALPFEAQTAAYFQLLTYRSHSVRHRALQALSSDHAGRLLLIVSPQARALQLPLPPRAERALRAGNEDCEKRSEPRSSCSLQRSTAPGSTSLCCSLPAAFGGCLGEPPDSPQGAWDLPRGLLHSFPEPISGSSAPGRPPQGLAHPRLPPPAPRPRRAPPAAAAVGERWEAAASPSCWIRFGAERAGERGSLPFLSFPAAPPPCSGRRCPRRRRRG